MIVFFLRVLAW